MSSSSSSSPPSPSLRKPLNELLISDVKSLKTKEQFLEYQHDLKSELEEFTHQQHHLDLLLAIKERAIIFMAAKEPFYQKIRNKYYKLVAKANKIETIKKNSDIDPGAFVEDYSEEKYKKHKVTSVKVNTTILKIKNGRAVEKVEPPSDFPEEESLCKVKESGLLIANFYRPQDLTNQQKNDVVAILGHAFALSMTKLHHNTAKVAHALLHDGRTRVVIIEYCPYDGAGNIRMKHTVAAAIFYPVAMTRHLKDGSTTGMRTIKAVNLVQLGLLPCWKGRNLGTIVMENMITERLKENGIDLMMICGCFQDFYRGLETISGYPDWLWKSPFHLNPRPAADEEYSDEEEPDDEKDGADEAARTLDDEASADEAARTLDDETSVDEAAPTLVEEASVDEAAPTLVEEEGEDDDDDDEDAPAEGAHIWEEHNRNLFFYQTLNDDKCEQYITKPFENNGVKFSFGFDDYLKGYYEEEKDTENICPNAS